MCTAYQRFRQVVLIALEDVERSLVDFAEEQLERRELVSSHNGANFREAGVVDRRPIDIWPVALNG